MVVVVVVLVVGGGGGGGGGGAVVVLVVLVVVVVATFAVAFAVVAVAVAAVVVVAAAAAAVAAAVAALVMLHFSSSAECSRIRTPQPKPFPPPRLPATWTSTMSVAREREDNRRTNVSGQKPHWMLWLSLFVLRPSKESKTWNPLIIPYNILVSPCSNGLILGGVIFRILQGVWVSLLPKVVSDAIVQALQPVPGRICPPLHLGISQIIPIIRTVVYWGLFLGPRILGNYHL